MTCTVIRPPQSAQKRGGSNGLPGRPSRSQLSWPARSPPQRVQYTTSGPGTPPFGGDPVLHSPRRQPLKDLADGFDRHAQVVEHGQVVVERLAQRREVVACDQGVDAGLEAQRLEVA